MSGALLALYGARAIGGGGFSPTDNTYTSSTSVPIPSGATGYEIWVNGGGAGGGRTISGNGGGGGGAGTAYRSGSVLSGEWGANLTLTIGAPGSSETGATTNDATNGGNSTLSGTLGGVGVSMTGNGGAATQSATGGAGGSASGGSVNTSGNAGTNGSVGVPGVGGAPGVAFSGVGVGSNGEADNATGGGIRIKFT